MDWLKEASGPPRSSSQCTIGVAGAAPVPWSGSAGRSSPSRIDSAIPAGVRPSKTSRTVSA
ncbi:hypothetical protein SBADM41S_05438 [Streptomyces badius]